MPLENLSQEQLALKDQLLKNFDQIELLIIVSPVDGSLCQIDRPRIQYFNPYNCRFRIRLPNNRAKNIFLQSIKEVQLCG